MVAKVLDPFNYQNVAILQPRPFTGVRNAADARPNDIHGRPNDIHGRPNDIHGHPIGGSDVRNGSGFLFLKWKYSSGNIQMFLL